MFYLNYQLPSDRFRISYVGYTLSVRSSCPHWTGCHSRAVTDLALLCRRVWISILVLNTYFISREPFDLTLSKDRFVHQHWIDSVTCFVADPTSGELIIWIQPFYVYPQRYGEMGQAVTKIIVVVFRVCLMSIGHPNIFSNSFLLQILENLSNTNLK